MLVCVRKGSDERDSFDVDTVTRDGYVCIEEPLAKAIVNLHRQHSDCNSAQGVTNAPNHKILG